MDTKKLIITNLFLAGIDLILIMMLSYLTLLKNNQKTSLCEVQKEIKYIRGTSMAPILKPKQKITVLYGYYTCHKIKRDDIVLLDYTSNDDLLIKAVKIVPGDKFYTKKNGDNWNIYVNGEILKNFQGEAYVLNEKKAILLQDYERQYQGIMPEGYYYVLGNIPEGSMDSTLFGLVGKKQILAKAGI